MHDTNLVQPRLDYLFYKHTSGSNAEIVGYGAAGTRKAPSGATREALGHVVNVYSRDEKEGYNSDDFFHPTRSREGYYSYCDI
jgi:hypothetical protein